jgi:hypothetical protein
MQRLSDKLIALGVVGVLAVTGMFMNSRQTKAEGSAPVTIVGPLPVPVTGSTTVSGAVAATQSGSWNVGIIGQPLSVSVANSPTVGLTAGTTVFTKNVEEPGRVPFQATVDGLQSGDGSFFSFFAPVPSNTRLVIKQVSARFTANIDNTTLNSCSLFNSQDASQELVLQATQYGARWVVSEAVTFYVEPSHQPYVFCAVYPAAGGTQTRVSLSGYYVALP